MVKSCNRSEVSVRSWAAFISTVVAARCARSSFRTSPCASSLRRAVDAPNCETCHRPTVACVCDRVVRHETQRRILVLQHPQERDAILGSAQLLTACLPKARLVVGLSWQNFAAALGEQDVDVRKWAVLFPDND